MRDPSGEPPDNIKLKSSITDLIKNQEAIEILKLNSEHFKKIMKRS